METAVQTERRWPTDNGPWLLRVSFAATATGLIPVGVEMWAVRPPTESQWTRWRPDLTAAMTGPTTPLDPQHLRVPLTRLAEETSAGLAHHLSAILARQLPQADTITTALGTHRKRGRPALYPPEHFAAVADTYRQIGGRKPTTGIAERYGVSRSTAAHWVWRARRMGLLKP